MNFLKNEKTKKIIIVIMILLIIGLLINGIISYLNTDEDNNQIDIYNEDNNSNNEIDEEGNIISEDTGIDLQEEIQVLNLKYENAIAWLKVPSTSIDFPIFQSEDNSRYLRNDRDNVNTGWGETFMDYRCDINKMDDKSHFIIYGHNTEEDTCFTPLLKYKEKEFFDNNKLIEMSTLNGNYKWKIFSVYQTDTDFFYIDTNFNDMTEYTMFLESLSSKSMYDTEVEVTGEDTILTLSTCDYYKTNGRFVVQAKLIK